VRRRDAASDDESDGEQRGREKLKRRDAGEK
jgi:hypothetical protein